MKNKNRIPNAIYIDTNILYNFIEGTSDSNLDFIDIKEILKNIKVDFYIPEVVKKEFFYQKEKKLKEHLKRVKDNIQSIKSMLGSNILEFKELEDFNSIIKKKINKELELIEIKIIRSPGSIKLKELIDMAIKKIPRFELKREKGFRDSIILFTILEHIKSNKYNFVYFITNDKIFRKDTILERFKRINAEVLILSDFNDAKNELKKNMNNLMIDYLENEKMDIKRYLNKNFEKISEYIQKNASISNFFIQSSLYLKEYYKSSQFTIKRILNIKPNRVSDVRFGVVFSKDQIREKYKAITFTVEMKINLIIEEYNPSNEPMFKINELEYLNEVRENFSPIEEKELEEKINISIESEILKNNNDLEDFKILKIISY